MKKYFPLYSIKNSRLIYFDGVGGGEVGQPRDMEGINENIEARKEEAENPEDAEKASEQMKQQGAKAIKSGDQFLGKMEKMSETPLEEVEQKLDTIYENIVKLWKEQKGKNQGDEGKIKALMGLIFDHMNRNLSTEDVNALANSDEYEDGDMIYYEFGDAESENFQKEGAIIFGWDWVKINDSRTIQGWWDRSHRTSLRRKGRH
jgi:hypothetical protein